MPIYTMKILAISDTHTLHSLLELNLEGVDMIIHAGDWSDNKLTAINNNQAIDFLDWFSSLPVKYKVIIPGNHDKAFAEGLLGDVNSKWDIILLNHEFIEIEGIKIFGSPFTPEFSTGWAFNVPHDKIRLYWRDIPRDLDILITHGPPYRILDSTKDYYKHYKICGCPELLKRVKKVKPKVMIFGHIHDDGGRQMKVQGLDTLFINAACFGEDNKMTHNKGVYFEL